jgi:hypothetical protein
VPTDGNALERRLVLTARALSAPLATWGEAAITVSMLSWMCPPIRSVIAAPLALYATGLNCAPVLLVRSSRTTRAVELGTATLTLPGCALAIARTSCTLDAGKRGWANSTIATEPM